MDKDFEDRMDKIFRSNEQTNTLKLSTPTNSMSKNNNKTVKSVEENNSILNKQIGLRSSIAILGTVTGLVGFGVYYLVEVLGYLK